MRKVNMYLEEDSDNVVIFIEKLKELQENLIRSHAAGVGKALTPEKTRMLLALRSERGLFCSATRNIL